MTCAGAVGCTNPRSSSATGSSFLFLIAPITSGLSRSPQSGEIAVSSWTASPSVNQRGTRCPVAVSVYTWLISCHSVDTMPGGGQRVHVAHFVPQRGRPMEGPGLASRGAVHGHGVAERHAQRAQSRHAERAHREILVIRVH